MLDFLISSFNENPFDLHLGGSFTWSNSQESFMYCSDTALATHVANRMESSMEYYMVLEDGEFTCHLNAVSFPITSGV